MNTRRFSFRRARQRPLLPSGLLLLSALTLPSFAQTPPPAPPAAAATPTAAKPSEEEMVVLSPFSVGTDKDVGYRASNSLAGTRTNTPIKDIPLNIQVFTKELSDDLLITNQVDLERYNASLVNGGADVRSDVPIQQAYNQFLFRGFVQNWGLRDGIREYDPVDTQGLSRVEVVKGPAAPLYGLSYPGGVMNNITKDVDFDRSFTEVRLTAQSEGEYRASIDANYSGPAANGKIGLRFNGATVRSQDERAHSRGSIQYSQLSLTWKPLPATSLKLLGERGYREKPNGLSYFTTGETTAAGVGLGNGASIPLQVKHPEIPWTWNWSNGKNMRSLETKLYRGSVEHTFNESFSVFGYVQYSNRMQVDGNGWDANGSGGSDSWEAGGGWIIDPVTKAERIEAGYSYRDWSNNMHAYGATGVYKVEVAKVKNTFAFGANVWAEKFVSRSATRAGSANPIHIIYPVSTSVDPTQVPFAPPADLLPITTGNGFTHENNSNDYYFVSWQAAALKNRLRLNFAFNHTNLKLVQWANGSATAFNLTEQSKDSPMFGGMFDITKELSVYYSHSTSLFPTTDKNSFGTQMPPVVGKGDEVGAKIEFLEGKISGTLSYYKIAQTGGSQNNPTAENLNTQRWDSMTPAQRAAAFPGRTRSDLLGDLVPGADQESKGYEADLYLQFTRSWQMMFSYAHNDQEVVSAVDKTTIGQSTTGNIKDQVSILTKYSFTEGRVKGLYLGVGLQSAGKALQGYQSGVARYYPSTFYLETFGGYRWKAGRYNPSVQVNLKNMTKQDEFTGWQATGSSTVVATRPYEVPTKLRFSLTFGVGF